MNRCCNVIFSEDFLENSKAPIVIFCKSVTATEALWGKWGHFYLSWSFQRLLGKIILAKPFCLFFSDRKHSSWNASSVISLLIMWFQHTTSQSHTYEWFKASSSLASWFSTAALLLFAVLTLVCVSWPVKWNHLRWNKKQTNKKKNTVYTQTRGLNQFCSYF